MKHTCCPSLYISTCPLGFLSAITEQAVELGNVQHKPPELGSEPFDLPMPVPRKFGRHYLTFFFSHLSFPNIKRWASSFHEALGSFSIFPGSSPRDTDCSRVCPLFINYRPELFIAQMVDVILGVILSGGSGI